MSQIHSHNQKSKLLPLFLGLFIIGLIPALLVISKNTGGASSALDDFAKCLAEKKIIMYGADWCSHCQNQKKLFGSAFKFVPYVECPENPKLCLDAGINGFPTWIFPDPPTSSGQVKQKLEGEQTLEELSRKSGCPLQERQ